VRRCLPELAFVAFGAGLDIGALRGGVQENLRFLSAYKVCWDGTESVPSPPPIRRVSRTPYARSIPGRARGLNLR
jgi:hypothetical protein